MLTLLPREGSHGAFYMNPLGLDAVGQITGLLANSLWASSDDHTVYVIESCQSVCLSKQLRCLMNARTTKRHRRSRCWRSFGRL